VGSTCSRGGMVRGLLVPGEGWCGVYLFQGRDGEGSICCRGGMVWGLVHCSSGTVDSMIIRFSVSNFPLLAGNTTKISPKK